MSPRVVNPVVASVCSSTSSRAVYACCSLDIAGGLDEVIEGLAGGGSENVAANLAICDRVNGLTKPEE